MRRVLLGIAMLMVTLVAMPAVAQSCTIDLQNPRERDTTVSLFPTLKWSAGGNGVYDVYLATEKEGGCDVRDPYAKELRETSLEIKDGLQPGTTYFWKVVGGANALCRDGVTSACGTFTTVACPTNAPRLITPTGGTVSFGNVNFEWTAVDNAQLYRVYISIDGGQTFPFESVTDKTSKQHPLAMGQNVAWKVAAIASGGCEELLSETAHFETSCPTAVPTLFEPRRATIIPEKTAVTFKWTNVLVAGATYTLEVTDDGGREWTTLAREITENQFTATLENGDWGWHVIVHYENGCSDLISEPSQFYVGCPTVGPELVAPADGIETGLPVTFSWKSVNGGISYLVWLIGSDNQKKFLGQTTDLSLTASTIDAGSYEWFVEVSRGTACEHVASSQRRITIKSDCPTGTPVQISPANGATNVVNDVKFEWSGVAGASLYKLYVSEDGGAPILAAETKDTTATLTIKGSAVLWKVDAIFERCPTTASSIFRFTMKPECPTSAATPSSPANGASDVTSPVKFEWKPAAGGVTKYRLLVSIDGGTPFAAATTTDTTATVPLSGNSVSWLVETFFGDNCTTQSQAFRFTLFQKPVCPDPGTAVPQSPENGAKGLTSPITFRWQEAKNASSYRVIYGSGAQQKILGTTKETFLTADVPAGDGYWLVQSLFGDDCPTTLSDRFSINVTDGAKCSDDAPRPISPANGSTTFATRVKFEWTAVPDAIKYLLLVSTGGQFDFYGTTDQTFVEAKVPVGTVRWLVVAQFAGCPEKRSEIVSFTVAEEVKCPEGTVELISPRENESVSSPVRLLWKAVDKATSYRVWYAQGRNAASIIARTTINEATVNAPAGEGTWSVEALFDGFSADCPPIRSADAHFTVKEATNCNNNAAPKLSSPVGTEAAPAQTTSPVTLAWEASAGAAAYRVFLASSGQAFEDLGVTRETSIARLLAPGKYAWFVQAFFDNCPPVASDKAYFLIAETKPRCSNELPSVVAPVEGATVQAPVTISWSDVADAVKYRVFGSVDGSDPILLGTTAETSIIRPLPPGLIVISVEAVFEECPSTFSSRRTFRVEQAQTCSNAKARLVAPANNSTQNGPVDFMWEPVSGAIRYVLVARLGDGTATPIADTTETTVRRTPPPGLIEWWVVTFFRGCDETESEHFRFNVPELENCDNRKPIALLPAMSSKIDSPAHFAWTPVPHALGYQVWAAEGQNAPNIIAATNVPHAKVELPPGVYHWYVVARFDGNCPTTESAPAEFEVVPPVPCGTPDQPNAHVVGQALSNTDYFVRWTPLANVSSYELQEATNLEFTGAQTFTLTDTFKSFTHDVTAPTQYLYRVRGTSNCNDNQGVFSDRVGVFVVPARNTQGSAELGTGKPIIQKVFLPGSTTPTPFKARTNRPWAKVTPVEGTLPTTGLELTITTDESLIGIGTNTFTLLIEYGGTASRLQTNATTVSTPISVTLVTPITPVGKGTPPPDALIFGAVGHGPGQNNSLFESDVRITNLSAQTMKYQVNFTPSGTDGTVTGNSTTIEIAPNQTMALDDIMTSFFGVAPTGSALGMLEVRPLTTSTSTGGFFSSVSTSAQKLLTLGSSRTYNFTPNGTFGQFIPATPFSKFVGTGKTLLLQQVAQSSAYRANFGFLEASGQPVELDARVFDAANNLLATIPIYLKAGEHQQQNLMLALNGITELADGRVEVEVKTGTGKVSAYVSEVDNVTNDPLLVSAVEKSATGANRYVVPGMAHKDLGFAFWVSDLRVFNSGTTAQNATLTFHTEGNPSLSETKTVTINPGEIKVLDDVVQKFFTQPNGAGGSVVITTPQNSQLIPTARTYNKTGNGTYGQYIPGVTVAESVGKGEQALQILQVENSSRFRTNIGLNETTGNPVTVEVAVILPDSIVTPVVQVPLAANEYKQIGLVDFQLGDDVYNARVTVKVIDGAGRVTSYGSMIDALTNDPTYVPPQR